MTMRDQAWPYVIIGDLTCRQEVFPSQMTMHDQVWPYVTVDPGVTAWLGRD
jgi:hypothetical protein